MDYDFISKTAIFRGVTGSETEAMLQCLHAYSKTYGKDETVYRTGDHIDSMGLILWGSVNIEQGDVWGRISIIDNIGRGQVFAETYACMPGEPLMVDVIAAEETEILFLNAERVLTTCPSSCTFHSRLIRNLLAVMAGKNLNLTRKIGHITPRSIRERLLSYLSLQAIRQGRYRFEIPFNRQQLADYLCVDRSAMSNELSKMRREGLLEFEKNRFCLKEDPQGGGQNGGRRGQED